MTLFWSEFKAFHISMFSSLKLASSVKSMINRLYLLFSLKYIEVRTDTNHNWWIDKFFFRNGRKVPVALPFNPYVRFFSRMSYNGFVDGLSLRISMVSADQNEHIIINTCLSSQKEKSVIPMLNQLLKHKNRRIKR